MEDNILAKLASSLRDAEAGIDYHPKHGAICPWCGHKLTVKDTKPWSGNSRIRYQKCTHPGCWFSQIDKTIKTIESVSMFDN